MKQFVAGVITTLVAGVLLAWVTDLVPTVGSAGEALDSAMQASADAARVASIVSLVLACLAGFGVLAYWIWWAVAARRGSLNYFGVRGFGIGTAVTFALAFAGLRSWSEVSSAAVPLLLGALAVGVWTINALRRRLNVMFRIA